jgi:hypothetical protein
VIARREALAMLAGVVSLLAGCDSDPKRASFLWQAPYSAKLKVEVDTPVGVKSGFSVIEVRRDKTDKGYQARGEAVAVDLPHQQTLFVLLRSQSNPDWVGYLHSYSQIDDSNGMTDGTIGAREAYNRRVAADRRVWRVARRRKTAVEDSDNYPYFVRFRDIADPKSVEQVDPDDLAKSFGPGVKLKSLTVQVTDEPVSEGIGKRLPKPPFIRSFVYQGEESKSLGLYKGKVVSERIGTESFMRGTQQ